MIMILARAFILLSCNDSTRRDEFVHSWHQSAR